MYSDRILQNNNARICTIAAVFLLRVANLARFLALDAQNPGTGAKRFPELIFRFALQLWML
jgi:hypothetical protein